MFKKIAFVGSNSPHIQKFLIFFSNYFEKIILITNKVPEKKIANCIYYEVDFSFKKIWNILFSVKMIRDIFKKERPEIIHIHQANSYAFYTLLANSIYKIPVILSPWGSDIFILPNKNILMKEIVIYNLSNANIITLESFYGEKVVRNLLKNSEKDIRILNYGIYDDYFVDIEDALNNKKNIIFSNRLHKKFYRIDKIIKAFEKFIKLRSNNDWRLVIAGEGEDTLKLKRLVYDNNLEKKVEFVGWLDKNNLKEWYVKSKIFVSIPESDGVPFSMLEAMACGCLPVVSNVPSVLEMLIDGLNSIIAIDIENLDKYLLKAIELYNSPGFAKELFYINRKILEKHAVFSKNMNEFLGIYTYILNKNKIKI